MRLILQRVSSASVEVKGDRIAAIDFGMLVLVGVERGDGDEQVAKAAQKLATLRIFSDEQGQMNLDIVAVGGSVLLVSQFTLAGSLTKGRRPSFERAAPPAEAEALIEKLRAALVALGTSVVTGQFGARMQVELVNDGPVTFVLDLPPADPGLDGP